MFESRFFLFSLTQEPTCSDCLLLSYVAQTGLDKDNLKLLNLKLPPLEFWNCSLAQPPQWIPAVLGMEPRPLCMFGEHSATSAPAPPPQ